MDYSISELLRIWGRYYFNRLKNLSVDHFDSVRLCATLWTVVCQLPLSIEFSRPEYWSGWLVPSPGDLPNSVIKPRSPTLKVDSLPAETPVDENSLFVFKSFKKLLCYICA